MNISLQRVNRPYEFTFVCDEPEGARFREVKPLKSSDIARVYESLCKAHTSRGRELPQELAIREFARLDKLYWTVDDVGIIIASEAGDVHIFFWDKRLRGRERMCKEMAQIIMDFYHRSDVWTEIPSTERAVIAFAERVGFEREREGDTVMLRLKGN